MYLANKKCRNCILCTSQNICRLTNLTIDKEKDYCSKHLTQDKIFVCDFCGEQSLPFDDVIINIDDINYKHLCGNCAIKTKTCQFCKNMPKCLFETSSDSTPKTIIQEQQIGNRKIQMQIKNPEREKLFCHNCCCWNIEQNTCIKNTDFECKNKKINYLV